MKAPSLSRRILYWMAIVGLVPLLLMAAESHYFSKKAFYDSERGHLNFSLNSRLAWIQAWLNHTRKEFHYASLADCGQERCHGELKSESGMPICNRLVAIERGHASYDGIAIYNPQWSIISVSQDTAPERLPTPTEFFRKQLPLSSDFIIAPGYHYRDGHIFLTVGQPGFLPCGTRSSYILAHLNLTKSLTRILGDSSDLGDSGKIYLLAADGRYLWYPPHLASRINGELRAPEQLLRPGQIASYVDLQGQSVIGMSIPYEEMGWILVAEVDESEAFLWLKRGTLACFFTMLFSLVVIVALAVRSSRKLSEPLSELARVARSISHGQVRARVPDFQEKETREVGQAFNHMLDRLEISQRALMQSASLAAVGQLSSSIVHEMRNPLSSVKLNLQALALKVDDDPAYAEITEIGLQQTHRLESMLSDLLNYGKPLELNYTHTRFRHLVDSALHVVTKGAAEKKVNFEVQDELQEQPLWLDGEQIIRALVNLLANAVEWSPAGGTVRVLGRQSSHNEEEFCLQVSDQGPGVPAERRRKLFQPFFTTRRDGTGLGLANVRKIVEYHGGTVIARNGSQEGAVFTLYLPLRGVGK